MTARELHDATLDLLEKGVDRLCYGTDERQIVLRALDLLARVEESEDELVRELRDQADEERQFEYPERAKLLDMAAATIVALKAERDELKRHAEAMHKSANSYLNDEDGDTWEVLQHHLDSYSAYRRDFPKEEA